MIRPRRAYSAGEAVKVIGHVADEHGQVDPGLRGTVEGDNHTQRGADGITRTIVRTQDGQILAVPTTALERSK